MADVQHRGVVHDSVEAGPVFDPRQCRPDAGAVGHVERGGAQAVTGRAQPVCRLDQGLGVHIRDQHAGTFGEALPGNGEADAARGPGDQDTPAVKKHRRPPTRPGSPPRALA